MSTIAVKYSCSLCGLHEVTVQVETRKPDQDLGDWMGILSVTLSVDHNQRSRSCHPRTLSKVMIPVTENDPIGAQSH